MSNCTCLELQLINNYFADSNRQDGEYTRLFFDLINIISANNGGVSVVKWEILNYLDTAENFIDLQEFLKKLAVRLRAIEERTIDKSPEEVFTSLMDSYEGKNNKQNIKILMILVMYFYRDKAETMLKFYHKDFQNIDYVLFSMFFGADCQYIGLPPHIKKIEGLDYYISNRMAEFYHKSRISEYCRPSFKKVAPPKFVINDLIKEKTNVERDGFLEWISDFLSLENAKFLSWELRHKGFSCDSNSPLRFKLKPTLNTLVNMTEIEQQLVVATTGNDKDLFDFNTVFSQYKKLVK